ncbi:AAA family ATPase [Sorangium sp. So ce394]|uniref:AAA family ATPase n=1 Tax=Sorangium sp. So ce394 TaxID=3133310 RepID=UPI003F5B6490
MRINPGGSLGVDEIIGRETEIARYWSVLARQGLVLGGERRIGKTHIVKKMHALGRDGFVTVYQELEAVHSLSELVRTFHRAVRDQLDRLGKFKASALEVWEAWAPKQIKNVDLPDIERNWKALLTSAITDTLKAIGPENRLVLIWDEFPLMIHNIKARQGADSAIQLLDLLRHLRQTHPDRLRFLLTGSIGLHLVLQSLRAAGNANAPMNDMLDEVVPPMSTGDAFTLITELLRDIDPQVDRPDRFVPMEQKIFEAVGGFPFYLQHVIDRLSQLDRIPVPSDVDVAVDELVLAPNDPGHFHWNVERIKIYYDKRHATIALAILDAIAEKDRPMRLAAIVKALAHHAETPTAEDVREVSRLLCQDLCLVRIIDKKTSSYDFRWPLVKRWWQKHRL